MIEIACLDDGKDGTEDLLLCNGGFGIDIGNNRCLDKASLIASLLAARNESTAFLNSFLNVAQNFFLGAAVDYRAEVVARVISGTDFDLLCLLFQ